MMSRRAIRMFMSAAATVVLTGWPVVAAARSAEIGGKLGYLSEWEVTATVTEQVVGGRREFAGPLTVRHVGLCAPGRPVEMAGEIRFRIAGWVTRRLEATLVIDGKECGFSGKIGETVDGVLTCEQWKGVPASLSIKTTE
jgi:hypothetical protein